MYVRGRSVSMEESECAPAGKVSLATKILRRRVKFSLTPFCLDAFQGNFSFLRTGCVRTEVTENVFRREQEGEQNMEHFVTSASALKKVSVFCLSPPPFPHRIYVFSIVLIYSDAFLERP
jgi:hypothetical protein